MTSPWNWNTGQPTIFSGAGKMDQGAAVSASIARRRSAGEAVPETPMQRSKQSIAQEKAAATRKHGRGKAVSNLTAHKPRSISIATRAQSDRTNRIAGRRVV